jgi:hypothetical protein
MARKRTTRIVWRSNGKSSRRWFEGARAYGDFRDLGGKLYEPLKAIDSAVCAQVSWECHARA